MDITVCRADKTEAYVLVNTEEYHWKLDEILADGTKFLRITKNLVEDIKLEVNRIIETVSAPSNALCLPSIVGYYDLGYIYRYVRATMILATHSIWEHEDAQARQPSAPHH